MDKQLDLEKAEQIFSEIIPQGLIKLGFVPFQKQTTKYVSHSYTKDNIIIEIRKQDDNVAISGHDGIGMSHILSLYSIKRAIDYLVVLEQYMKNPRRNYDFIRELNKLKK